MRNHIAVFLLTALWVMDSEAWFWSWSGTTTLSPAVVNSEGSGSPEGSGEGPLENIATVIQEDIIEETHRVQKLVQTWNETTVTPQLTTTEAPHTGPAPGRMTKTGNGTSSRKGTVSSEGSGVFTSAGKLSGLGAGHESKLVSDAGVGVWSDSGSGSRSESGLETRPGTILGSALEIEIFERSEQGENIEGDHKHSMSQANGVRLDPQETSWLASHKTDEGQSHEESSYFAPQGGRQNKPKQEKTIKTQEANWDIQNLSSHLFEKPVRFPEVSDSEDAFQLAPKIQTPDHMNQLPARESTARQQTSPSWISKTSGALSASQTATTALSTTATPEDLSSQPQVSAAKRQVLTSKMTLTEDAPKKSLTEFEPSESSKIRQVDLGMREPAGGLQEPLESTALAKSPQCLLLESSLPFCSSLVGQQFTVPNFLNQSSVTEVRELLSNWAWLLNSKCHHSLEWFFCLLLLPNCGRGVRIPCRSFCEVLKDSCWMLLDQGHLPVECQALPEEEEEDGYRCLSVSNQKGKGQLK